MTLQFEQILNNKSFFLKSQDERNIQIYPNTKEQNKQFKDTK